MMKHGWITVRIDEWGWYHSPNICCIGSGAIPTKIPVVFASQAPAGNVTSPIPTAPPGGGLVSRQQGFGTINFTQVAAGGIPPWGKDVNALFQEASQWLQWDQAGGAVPYDATFQTNIGGYPKGAAVASATTPGVLWLSTVDNNLTNPDAIPIGAGWTPLLVPRGQQYYGGNGTFNLTVPAGVDQIFVDGCGAGGGGGAGFQQGDISSGGGGAERRSGWITVVPGEILTIVIGLGGVPGISGGNGNPGGNTTITGNRSGLIYRAGGGGGGIGTNGGGIVLTPGAAGAGGIGGQRGVPGSVGGIGWYLAGSPFSAFSVAWGGATWGGSSPTAVEIQSTPGTVNGNSGIFPGSGGTGTANGGQGGAGHDGELFLQWGNYG